MVVRGGEELGGSDAGMGNGRNGVQSMLCRYGIFASRVADPCWRGGRLASWLLLSEGMERCRLSAVLSSALYAKDGR